MTNEGDTNIILKRRPRSGNALLLTAGGTVAIFTAIKLAAPYLVLPQELEKTQKQLDQLTTSVQNMQKTAEERSRAMEALVANIDGKLGYLLRDSNLRNNRQPNQ